MKDKGYLSPVLKEMVSEIKYKPHWQRYIEHEIYSDGSGGWHFFIISNTENSLKPDERVRVRHGFLIPAASYNEANWLNWIKECYDKVERHETGEFFRYKDVRVFAPHHSNGEDPYTVWYVGDHATAAKKSGDD